LAYWGAMEFRQVGRIRVDSGLLLLIDPCYVHSDASPASTAEAVRQQLLEREGGQLNYPLGHAGLGVVAPRIPVGLHDVWVGEEEGTVWRLEVWFGERLNTTLAHRILGSCGVDAGQVMVVDPNHLDPHWVEPEAAAVVGVSFWGRDEQLLLDELKERVEDHSGGIGNHLVRGADGSAIEAEIRAIASRIGADKVVTHIERLSSYEAVCATTGVGAGALSFPDGTEGWIVATTSGEGDGTYKVAEVIGDGATSVAALVIDFRGADDGE
jgi:hypothetical protein